ncbi:DNA-binding protein [Streptococcus pseudoporcinus]|uniref:DNA-binding protein n=1 Tax=Streptococcus pseudoporcinus TaxID=361101 RepID=A0A4U9YRT3_9STRE|nr:ATP-binding protein [Streptococcus pseudoporcinus]VTS29823.1 DNA-binding protein [Streptococcus pseudoporcinus]
MAYEIPEKIDLGEQRYVKPLDRQNNKDKSAYDSMFSIEFPKRGFDKLVLSKRTQKQIDSIITKIMNYDLLYNKFGLSEIDSSNGRTLINLYGPPGTGKSFAAEAIAYKLNKKIVRANYSEIESKYVGETPKNIKAIFEVARREDAILIFDEADSILGKRLSSITQSTDHAVNVAKSVMLLEMDQFSGITIFTTNFGKNYDSAFVRRIIGHIKFELPDSNERENILNSLIPDKLPISISREEKGIIVAKTEGFSGGDLLNLIIYASSSAVERDGEKCSIKINDFLEALNLIKEAKLNIGLD